MNICLVWIRGYLFCQNRFLENNEFVRLADFGSDVWIASGCSILDGVEIGDGCVIAAGAVVNRSVPPFSVIGGVPAKTIKMRRA